MSDFTRYMWDLGSYERVLNNFNCFNHYYYQYYYISQETVLSRFILLTDGLMVLFILQSTVNEVTVIPIALMRDDITQAWITTKPRFENANFRFYHELIPKVAMMKRIPTWKHHENEGLRKCHANEAWWWLLNMLRNRT